MADRMLSPSKFYIAPPDLCITQSARILAGHSLFASGITKSIKVQVIESQLIFLWLIFPELEIRREMRQLSIRALDVSGVRRYEREAVETG